MAQKPANQAQAKQVKARHSSSMLYQMVIMGVLGLGMVFATPSMLVIFVGLLPTFVALMVDTTPQKYAARAVGFLNVAGLMPYLGSMWMGDNSLIGAMKILTDPVAWLVIYSAAGIGWFLHSNMPAVGALLLEANAGRRIHKLEAERLKLISDWGKDVESAGQTKG